MAISLATTQAVEATTLNRLREQHSIEEATLLTPRGRVIAQSGVGAGRAAAGPAQPQRAAPGALAAERSARSRTIPERGLYLRVIVPVNVLTIADDIRVLQVLQRVPPRDRAGRPAVSRRGTPTTASCSSRART